MAHPPFVKVCEMNGRKNDIDGNSFRKKTGEYELKSIIEKESCLSHSSHLPFPPILFEERKIIHRFVRIPCTVLRYIHWPDFKLSTRKQGVDNRNVSGNYGNIVLCTLSSENNGYGFLHFPILPYSENSSMVC